MVCLAAIAGCSPPPPRPGPGPEVGYIEWAMDRMWRMEDLPSVAASYDRLCERAGEDDDEAASANIKVAATSLWVIRELLLPLLRSLPDPADVPDETAFSWRCALPPDEALVAAAGALDADPVRATETAAAILGIENGPGGAGLADEARFARAIVAARIAVESGGPAASPRTAASVALLRCPPCAPPGDPEAVWAELADLALARTEGSDAVARANLSLQARDALALRGYLDLLAYTLLPVAEDADSNLRALPAELVRRLARAWGAAER